MNESKELKAQEAKSAHGRRRFLKKAGVTSLVLSLPSQSVWGNTCTPSGNLSGNLSQNHNHDTCSLAGKSPGYWHNHLPLGYENVTWYDVFGMGRPPLGTNTDSGNDIPDTTLLPDFLPKKKTGKDNPIRGPFNLNRHLMAAYLNADQGFYPLAPGVTAKQYVSDLYDEVIAVGEWSAAAEDIKDAIDATYA